MKLDSVKFSKTIKEKRIIKLNQHVRVAAKEIGISPATLSRLENNHTPDLITYAKVCHWLKKDMSTFIKAN